MRIGLILREQDSTFAPWVDRLRRNLETATGPQRKQVFEQLETMWAQADEHAHLITEGANRVVAWLAAERLARELRVPLLQFEIRLGAYLPGDLALSLGERINRNMVEVEQPGDKPAGVIEEVGPDGPVIRWRQPKRHAMVNLLMNVVMVAFFLLMVFLVPGEKEFRWDSILPFIAAVVFLIPIIIRRLFSKESLELTDTQLRYCSRFAGTRVKAMPWDDLKWIMLEPGQTPTLHILGTLNKFALPMAEPVALWVRRRIESFLTGRKTR
jgi:hypothetical protein